MMAGGVHPVAAGARGAGGKIIEKAIFFISIMHLLPINNIPNFIK